MKKIIDLLPTGKNSRDIQSTRTKSFGYQVLGFGSGGAAPLDPTTVEYVIIGGGGTGNHSGGGGGAGGYRANVSGEASGGQTSAEPSKTLDTYTDYALTVGAAYNSSVLDSITSLLGGHCGGGSQPGQGGEGLYGCGGGQGGTAQGPHSPTNAAGTTGQGMAGGTGTQGSDQAGAGGGTTGNGPNGHGPGGVGLASSITGSSVGRGGGGGNGPDGGFGGGYSGNGPGEANTGGGGMVAPGGSGIVIIRYPVAYTATASVGLTASTVIDGDYKATSFTAGTGTFQLG